MDNKLTPEMRNNILICIGIVAETQSHIRAAIDELVMIETQYVRALSQPQTVALDTIDPLADRLRAVGVRLAEVLK